MAICKDCLHVEACKNLYEIHGDGLSSDSHACKYFKDRARFVELPQSLKIGDEVWCVFEDLDDLSLEDYKYTVGNNAVSDIPQVVTEVGKRGFWIDPIGNGFKPEWNEFYRWDEFGKTVFLTREEAEQALKERKENPGG